MNKLGFNIRNILHPLRSPALAFGVAAILTGSEAGFAQGADCANAQAISGVTQINFVCHSNGYAFYQWTAPQAGSYFFEYRGSIHSLFYLDVDPGVGCAATGGITIIGAGGSGGFPGEGSVTVNNAGDTFLLTCLDQPGGVGQLTIRNDCIGLTPDVFEPNDTCARATVLSNGFYSSLNLDYEERDLYQLCVAPGDTLLSGISLGLNTSFASMYLFSRQIAASCVTPVGNPTLATGVAGALSWTNNTGTDQVVILEIAADGFPGTSGCVLYGLSVQGVRVCAPGAAGLPFCDPMDPNSTGNPAQLSSTLPTGTGSELHLEVTQGPPGEFAYFLAGSGSTEPGIPISQGRLCLDTTGGNLIGRYNFGNGEFQSLGRFDTQGVLQNLVGTSAVGSGFDVPSLIPNGGGAVMSGDTWHFQCWFRDTPAAPGNSKFSNGLSIVF